MRNKNQLFHSKWLLKFHTKHNNFRQEEMEVVAKLLKQVNIKKQKELLYTKEQLFALDFDAFQINRYFHPVRDKLWGLNNLIIVNDEIIESFEQLCDVLKINNKLAS